MQDWVVVTLAAFIYALVMFAFDRVFRLDERSKVVHEFTMKLRDDPNSISDDDIARHTKEMYKTKGLRLVMVFIVFYPLYYAFSSRYGDITTPLGMGMHWLWWFVVSSIVAQLFIGGVKRWLVRLREG
ncbi:MAG TPA: hypothetical protein EYP16_01400 [Candidatus Atribacteria bacterium]|nr:hypothetical protein [Candidatus Atribacteria bacterium]